MANSCEKTHSQRSNESPPWSSLILFDRLQVLCDDRYTVIYSFAWSLKCVEIAIWTLIISGLIQPWSRLRFSCENDKVEINFALWIGSRQHSSSTMINKQLYGKTRRKSHARDGKTTKTSDDIHFLLSLVTFSQKTWTLVSHSHDADEDEEKIITKKKCFLRKTRKNNLRGRKKKHKIK